MSNHPLVLDYANLFCGSGPDDDLASNHLVLSEVKLPTMEIQYVDHRPGGAPVAVEIDVVMTRLDLEFEVLGITPQIMALLRNLESTAHDFHVYGNLRDYMSGSALQLYARLRGQLARAEAVPFRKGNVFTQKYQVRGIMRYELFIGKQDIPIYRWDFFENDFTTGTTIL